MADSTWDDVLSAIPAQQPGDRNLALGSPAATGAPPSAGSWWKVPAYLASKGVEGALGLAGLPGTAGQLGFRAINSLNPWGIPSDSPKYSAALRASAGGLPTSNDLIGMTDAAGITNNPTVSKDRGMLTRLAGGAVEALPAAAVDLASGGALTPALLSAGGAGLAAETAHEITPGSSWAPILAGLAGGYGVGKLGQNVAKALDYRALGKAVTQTSADAEAAAANLRTLRDNKTSAGYSADDLFNNRVAASKADLEQFNKSALTERDAFHAVHDDTVAKVADSLAPSQTLEDAGEAAQAGARSWIGVTLPKKISALWAPVDKAIPADTAVPLTGFRNALAEINKSAGALEPLAAGIKPRTPSTWQTLLGEMDEDLAEGGKVTKDFGWKDVAKFRTVLGDAMSNPTVLKDVGQQNLSRLYATLTGDMSAVAKSAGAGDLFSAANAGSSQLYSMAEGTMGKLVRNKVPEPTDPLPGKAADSLLRTGAKDSGDLSVLRAETPEAADHLAAVALRTGQWSKLSEDSKVALIPDSEKRSMVEFSLKAKEDASEAAAKAMAEAIANHKANIDLAAREKTSSKRGLELGFQQARTASEAAAAKAKATEAEYAEASRNKPDVTGAFRDFLHGAVGGGLGHSMISYGGDMLNALGVHTDMSPKSAAVLGATLGYLIPKMAAGSKNMLVDAATNPASRKAALVGATAGSFWQPQTPEQRNELTGH